jgi:hypothetical protein
VVPDPWPHPVRGIDNGLVEFLGLPSTLALIAGRLLPILDEFPVVVQVLVRRRIGIGLDFQVGEDE